VHRLGGFRSVGKQRDEAEQLLEDAHAYRVRECSHWCWSVYRRSLRGALPVS
jgi:hypothetical protein